MSHMKTGDYWAATNEDESDWWLFLIVAHATANRKRYVLAVKCDWETRSPMVEDFTHAWWFRDSEGSCLSVDSEFYLAHKEPGNGQRYCS